MIRYWAGQSGYLYLSLVFVFSVFRSGGNSIIPGHFYLHWLAAYSAPLPFVMNLAVELS